MNYREKKQVLLVLFITMIMMATTIFTYGQTTINPDTVCVNAVGEQYFVTNTATSTYQWTIQVVVPYKQDKVQTLLQ